MRSMLMRALEHGLNGSAGYHALRAGDLGDEIKNFLRDAEIRRSAAGEVPCPTCLGEGDVFRLSPDGNTFIHETCRACRGSGTKSGGEE